MQVIRTIDEVDLKDKIVIVRTDYNVPMDGAKILDNTRILESVDNLRYILDSGAKKIVIISHLGRPLGNVVEEMRLKPIVAELEGLVGEEIDYLTIDPTSVTRKMIESSMMRIVCLENIRFDRREEDGDDKLGKILSSLGDIFILDGFSVAHRNHASVTKIAENIPSFAGKTFLRELNGIDNFLQNIKRPFWGFFGGIKLSDKMPVIRSLAGKLDGVVLGSSIALSFLHRFGFGVGDSVLVKDSDKTVDEFLDFMSKNQLRVVFPRDLVIGDTVTFQRKKIFDCDFEEIIRKKITPFAVCDSLEAIYDVGEKTIEELKMVTNGAGSIFWNGPFGYAEKEAFVLGTSEIAKMIIGSQALSMVGGGDTVGVITNLDLNSQFDFISTSGGAMMEYIANGTLPGIDILKNNLI